MCTWFTGSFLSAWAALSVCLHTECRPDRIQKIQQLQNQNKPEGSAWM